MAKNKKQVDYKKIYAQKGYRFLTRKDIINRMFSFLLDVCVMLGPIMIWNIIMMAVLGSILSVSGILFINIGIGILLILSILFMNIYIYKQTGGQSFGMRMMGFKVVGRNGEDVLFTRLVLRELLGFSIPFLALMFFLNIFGVVLYWMINALIVCIDPYQRSIPDFIFMTHVVGLLEDEEECEEEELVEEVKELPYKSNIDLHLYSDFSSHGECDVEELFQIAAKNQMHTIAIADVDCAKSNSIAIRMSELYHIHYIPAITINCEYKGIHLQVLGYFIDYGNELYTTIENESLVNEKQASIKRVRLFEQIIQKPIDMQHLLENNRFQKLPGELIAKHVLSKKEFEDCEVLKKYRSYDTIELAAYHLTKDYFAYGKPCYVSVKYPQIQDVLDVISLTNGVSVLAHPAKLLAKKPELVKELVDLGIDGVEVFYPSHDEQELMELMKFAMKHKLFITGGSGFYCQNSKIKMGEFHATPQAEALLTKFSEQ